MTKVLSFPSTKEPLFEIGDKVYYPLIYYTPRCTFREVLTTHVIEVVKSSNGILLGYMLLGDVFATQNNLYTTWDAANRALNQK